MAKEKEKETTVDVSKEIKTFGFTYSFQNGISVRIPIGIKNDDEKLKIHYDDIVDRSQFRPDSENVRLFRLSGQGSEGTPVYDSEYPFAFSVAFEKFRLCQICHSLFALPN